MSCSRSITAVAIGALLSCPLLVRAHEHGGHRGPTYEVTAPATPSVDSPRVTLRVVDDSTGKPIAARFSVLVDGRDHVPDALNPHGLRFVSIHTSKKQKVVVLYARGSGPVAFALPPDATEGEIAVTKGYEFTPQRLPFTVKGGVASATVRLRQWSTIREDGWLPADEHLHYDRLDPTHDADWLDMMAGDGLTYGHFMVLQGGNLPGVWAKQYAYGPKGEATDGRRLIVPGEEVRDPRQGHINLLGIGSVIRPISTGGMGTPPHPFNYPALHDVLLEARKSGGIGGPAHGGALARNSTVAVDTILGAAEFFEIANTHLYKTDVWYRLMNCGFIVPPVAGTDLPNYPFRDAWQPLLGETRTYVRVGKHRDFPSWKKAIRRGETFVSSGPLVRLTVNGVGPGGTVRLPASGPVEIRAELSSPQPLASLEIIRNGQSLDLKPAQTKADGIHRWTVRHPVKIDESCWVAARGSGVAKEALQQATEIKQNAIAHTAAVRIIVGDRPIRSSTDARQLIAEMTRHRGAYRTEGRFERAEHRARLLNLFDQAIQKLEPQVED